MLKQGESWRDHYKSLKEYYEKNFDKEYYSLTPEELEIDPDETIEDINAYSFERQVEEFAKCSNDFVYFCHKYIKIVHPTRGLVPFILYNYQRQAVSDFGSFRFNIVSKFRQGGLSTVAVLWGMWRCMFKFNESILVLSMGDREAKATAEIADRAMEYMPEWLRPRLDKANEHQRYFADTGSKLFSFTPKGARGRSITYLILDEAAFIPKMYDHWKSIYPTLSNGGNCIAISTVNGMGNWYEETYHQALEGKNPFHVIDLDYTQHPEFNDEKWVRDTMQVLGEEGWRQEVLKDFMGADLTYVSADLRRDIRNRVKNISPQRKLFPEFNNKGMTDNKSAYGDWEGQGALWVFREPIDGREYIMGVDGGEGIGEAGDNSCFQVIDAQTCEQCAEFYSNNCSIERFAKIVEQVAIHYNHALVVVESAGGAGLAILNKLHTDYEYDHLYYEDSNRGAERPGVKVTRHNRSLILDSLKSRVSDPKFGINSTRFVMELDTFIWNKATQRAEAKKGRHDDAIFAMAHALHVRDTVMRQNAFLPTDKKTQASDSFKLEIFEQIKAELQRGSTEEWLDPLSRNLTNKDDSDIFADYYARARPFDKLLREFGM